MYIVAAGVVPESDRAAAFSHVAILWTAAAKASPDIELAMSNTIAASHSVTYLLRSGSPPPPDGAALLRLEPLEDSDDQRREERRALLWVRDRPGLRAGLDDAVELNDGIPFHLLGDNSAPAGRAPPPRPPSTGWRSPSCRGLMMSGSVRCWPTLRPAASAGTGSRRRNCSPTSRCRGRCPMSPTPPPP